MTSDITYQPWEGYLDCWRYDNQEEKGECWGSVEAVDYIPPADDMGDEELIGLCRGHQNMGIRQHGEYVPKPKCIDPNNIQVTIRRDDNLHEFRDLS